MVPPAPGRFSITIGCPIAVLSWVATSRATKSVPPPAGKGTIRRTGFVGQSCATAGDAHRIRTAPTTAARSTVERVVILATPCRRGIHHGIAALEHVSHFAHREVGRFGSSRCCKLLSNDVALNFRGQNVHAMVTLRHVPTE